MEEFDKIKAFSESVAERQANLTETTEQTTEPEKENKAETLDLPQYLSQFRPQVPEEKSETNLLMWALGGLGVLLLVGVGTFAYFYGPNDDAQEIVVISPTPTPVKVAPESPGGLKIAGVDRVVYDRTSVHKAEVVEKLFPEPEEPVLPPTDQTVSVTEALEIAPVPQEADAVSVEVRQVEDIAQPADVQPFEPEDLPVVVDDTESIFNEQSESPRVVEEKPKGKAEPKMVEKTAVKPKTIEGQWRAQLLSSANKSKVEKAWKDISKKHKALLSDMPYQIVSAKISGKGTFYRLQVGSFATAEQATALCAKLKAKKQECIPTKQDK